MSQFVNALINVIIFGFDVISLTLSLSLGTTKSIDFGVDQQ